MEDVHDLVWTKEKKKPLTPTLDGNTPGTPLFDYFKDKLPLDLSEDTYGRGLSCYGYAKLITEELGGVDAARIMWIEKDGEDGPAHAFVVPKDAKPTDLAYNNTEPMDRENPHPLTVGEVLGDGTDITDLV